MKETLEEATERLFGNDKNGMYLEKKTFIKGVKWQQERSYSEEEVNKLISLLKQTTEYEVLQSFRDKVEQFKKK